MYKWFVVIFFLGYSIHTEAQPKEYVYSDSNLIVADRDSLVDKLGEEKKDTTLALPTDTLATIHEKPLVSDSMYSYKKDAKFKYINYLDSLLKRRQAMQKEDLSKKVKSINSWQRIFSSWFLKIILWGLAIVFIVVIIYHIFLNNVLFRKNSKRIVPEELIHEEQFFLLDYDALIRQSYLLKDYRMAIRYLFLKTLWVLAQKDMISYDASKTNSQYLAEIPVVLKPAFQSLLLSYEKAWYGNTTILQDNYQHIETRFSSFFKNI